MTTLILLCLALIGAGVFLSALQARVRGETPIMRKMFPAIAVVMLLASGCVGVAKLIPAHEPISLSANLHDSKVLDDYETQGKDLGHWLVRHCLTRNSGLGKMVQDGFLKWQYETYEFQYLLLQREQCIRAFANFDAARKKLWKHEKEEEEREKVRQAKEDRKWEERWAKEKKKEEELRAKKAAGTRRAVAKIKSDFNQALDNLWAELQEKKNYCEVVLHGTVILGEIEEHNERGIGAVAKEFRMPDGKLRGILEVAKQGCNPE